MRNSCKAFLLNLINVQKIELKQLNQPNPHAINNLRTVCILNLLDWFILDSEALFKFVSLIYFGILRFNFDEVGITKY